MFVLAGDAGADGEVCAPVEEELGATSWFMPLKWVGT
jgi:hypothetical protein